LENGLDKSIGMLFNP